MNNKMQSCIILLDNILFANKKYSRKSLIQKLKEANLSYSDSSVSRILKTIAKDFGIKIKFQNDEYRIIDEECEPNYLEKYNSIKSLLLRKIIQNSIVENSIVSEFISFGSTTLNKGIQNIEIILRAILEKKKLKIQYQKFSDDEIIEYVLKPIFIKEYQNRWYVISQNDSIEFSTYAFDRIEYLEVLDLKFIATNNFANFYKSTIGVTYSNKVEKIILKFSKWQANYIKTLPLHSSQEIISENDFGCVISISVNINFELEQLIKSYGSAVEVLGPKDLRQTITQDLMATLNFYKK